MPEVSVIIPSYNHARYLQQRIDSILAQTFTDFEIIILDDNSSDNSKEIIESYRSHPAVSSIIYNTSNSGSPFKQWEKGLNLANGKWVWIAESDDYSAPDFLETLLGNANKNDNIGISFCSSHWVNDKGEPGQDLNWHKSSFARSGLTEIHDTLCKDCSIQNVSSAILRKDIALEHIQGLGKYKACGDWIFYVRLLHDANLVFSENKLNYFRFFHDNTSSTASQSGVWVLEGIDLLFNIRYRKVKFTLKEIVRLLKFWRMKIRETPYHRKKNYKKLFLITNYLMLKTATGAFATK